MLAALTVAVLGGGALTACGAGGTAGGMAAGDGPRVVASTTVYADIARQVAGSDATVEAVISDPAADPHSFEASPADAAAVTGADLVVYNGAGYDSFVDRALENAADVPVVRAVDQFERVTSETVAEHDHAEDDKAEHDHGGHDDGGHGAGEVHDDDDNAHTHEHGAGREGAGSNEHVWFSLPTVAAVAQAVADELSAIDAEHAEQYRANAQRFAESLAPLEDRIDQIHDRGHFSYVQTEPLAAHLFDAAHMADATPRGFLSAIEDDTDPSAADLAATLDLVSERRVDFLAFNTQTRTPVTTRVRDAAEDAGLVVVDLTETLPDGADFLAWMTGIIDDLDRVAPATAPADGSER